MSVLKVGLENGVLVKNYKVGMQKLLPLPIYYKSDQDTDREFFAYITTLGGGFVNGDEYLQEFDIKNTKAAIKSQSSQKIYKGTQKLKNIFHVDENSIFVFHNDANIFYENCNFHSLSKLFCKNESKFFYLDGGFIGYANGKFSTNLTTRIFVDGKLRLNDVFVYEYDKQHLNAFYSHEYFYTLLIKDNIEITNFHDKMIKFFSSRIDDILVVRIASDDNDLAIKHIENIKMQFLEKNKMTKISAS